MLSLHCVDFNDLVVGSGEKRIHFTSTHFKERRDHYIHCIRCWGVVLKAGKIGTIYQYMLVSVKPNKCALLSKIHLSRPKISHVRGANQSLCEPMRGEGGGGARPMRDQHLLPLAVTPARHAAAPQDLFSTETYRFGLISNEFSSDLLFQKYRLTMLRLYCIKYFSWESVL